MNPSRLVMLIVAVFLCSQSVNAQAPSAPSSAPPFMPDKAFSADQVATMKIGMSTSGKIYMSDGKMREEMQMQGAQVILIMLPDQKKVYTVMPAQKMTMVMPLDDKMIALIEEAAGDNGKFELVGPETVEGVACTKYKMTTKGGKVFDWWVDAATKAPVKVAAEDGSLTTVWKNYKAGPQDPALFEPPKDYQLMQMPTGGAPGPGSDGGGQ